jgi:hexosaminidase
MVEIQPFISVSEKFSKEKSVFLDYASRKNLNFSVGDGGIVFKEKPLNAEEFILEISEGGVIAYACESKGAHNAFATILQKMEINAGKIFLPKGSFSENPDCSFRTMMVDVGRNWHPFEYLIKYVDLCYQTKATHLQIHFAENESVTLNFNCLKNLATDGRTYSRTQIKMLNEYAKERGIIIIPEVDLPGHTQHFCDKHPEIFGTLGVLPASEDVFAVLKEFYGELLEMFPDSPLIHIGGDEAAIDRWVNCEKTKAYMQKMGYENFDETYAEYIATVTNMILDMGRTPIVWEGFKKEYNDRISKKVLVMVWECAYQMPEDLIASGFDIINTSWIPLYVLPQPDYMPHLPRWWSVEEVDAWRPWKWKHFLPVSKATPNGYDIERNDEKIIGGMLCAWGDRLKGFNKGDLIDGLDKELRLLTERMPYLMNRLIAIDD